MDDISDLSMLLLGCVLKRTGFGLLMMRPLFFKSEILGIGCHF